MEGELLWIWDIGLIQGLYNEKHRLIVARLIYVFGGIARVSSSTRAVFRVRTIIYTPRAVVSRSSIFGREIRIVNLASAHTIMGSVRCPFVPHRGFDHRIDADAPRSSLYIESSVVESDDA